MAAFLLSGLLYAGGILCVYLWNQSMGAPKPIPVVVNAVKMSFAQMELVAAVEPSAPVPPRAPEPQPEEADVALEEIVEKLDLEPEVEPEIVPQLEPDQAVDLEPENEPVLSPAQVTQVAAAPQPAVDSQTLEAWVSAQIETEKYYPASAQRAGYEGTFQLVVKLDSAGTIVEAFVVSGKGHVLLRRALEKIVGALLGRSVGRPLDRAVELPFEFNFDLQ